MLGGMSGITRDVIPFGSAFGPKADLVGLNVVGLKRRKFSRAELRRIRDAYRILFLDTGHLRGARLARARAEFGADATIGKIVGFIQHGGKHPLMMPAAGGAVRSEAERQRSQRR